MQHGVAVYRDRPASLRWLQHHLDRLDEPLRLALAGKVKAGKSTLLNALVGERRRDGRSGRVHPRSHLKPTSTATPRR